MRPDDASPRAARAARAGAGAVSARARAALAVLGVLVVLGVLIGAGVGLLGGTLLGSVRVDDPAGLPPPRASVGSPTGAGIAPVDGGSVTGPASPGVTPEGSFVPSGSAVLSRGPLTLTAPPAVSAGGRLDLSGRYDGAPPGTVLQVQRRRQGAGWTDFPVQASTDATGSFQTWLTTSIQGRQEFRVRDGAAQVVSPAVTVTIS